MKRYLSFIGILALCVTTTACMRPPHGDQAYDSRPPATQRDRDYPRPYEYPPAQRPNTPDNSRNDSGYRSQDTYSNRGGDSRGVSQGPGDSLTLIYSSLKNSDYRTACAYMAMGDVPIDIATSGGCADGSDSADFDQLVAPLKASGLTITGVTREQNGDKATVDVLANSSKIGTANAIRVGQRWYIDMTSLASFGR